MQPVSEGHLEEMLVDDASPALEYSHRADTVQELFSSGKAEAGRANERPRNGSMRTERATEPGGGAHQVPVTSNSCVCVIS